MIKSLFLLGLVFLFLACKKDVNTADIPIITNTTTINVFEDDPAGVAKISFALSAPAKKDIIVFYSTSDSSAKSGQDYKSIINGQTQIQHGSISFSVQIPIYSDTLQKNDLVFKVHIDSVINGLISNRDIRVNIINVDYARLVWSDEFNDSIINTSNWNFEKGNNNGWGNNELEVYTDLPSNAYISNGCLVIKALSEGGSYTSARMTTQNKQTFVRGKVEIRAKLPKGKGIWPALWMLGSDITTVNWPQCGEIDIMELLGQDPSTVYGTVHFNNNGHQSIGSSHDLISGSFYDTFHIFSLIWQPHHLNWLIDNQTYLSVADSQISGFAFNLPQFFIFNIAVGGNWPGNPDSTTVFPQSMVIDYIRVYQ
jgi:Glycosyl hydrolases family 16/Calx-beta domain